jgi:hypothetical protein
MASAKPFRFLDLPAELRDQVYENIAAANTGPESTWSHCHLSMTHVCKQMRAELLPLYWRLFPSHADIAIWSFERFVAAFLDPIEGIPAISKVTVTISSKNPHPDWTWNALSLLSAKAQNRNMRWTFELVGPTDDSLCLAELRNAFDWVVNGAPPRLLRDTESGMFTEMSLRRTSNDKGRSFSWEWCVSVCNARGKLNEQERTKVADYCQLLAGSLYYRHVCRFTHWRRSSVVKIEVGRRSGRPREKYTFTTARPDMVRVN